MAGNTQTFTIEQYNALIGSLATGTLTVRYGDKTVTYRSVDEMLRIRALMAKELGLIKSGGRKIAVHSKNWRR